MLRILLIDDNPNDRLLVVRELKQSFSDVEIQTAMDAEAVAIAIAAGNFDLVITDYQLLWSDGLQVLQAVKARYPNCPVVMFTDSGSEEVAVAGMKAGLSDYVLKGRQLHRLTIAVRDSLDKQKLRHDYTAALEQLQTSQETLRFALEAGNAIAYSWDIKTGLVRRFNNLQSNELNEPSISTFEDVVNLVYADDRDHFRAAVDAALERGTYAAEFRSGQTGDTIRWIYDRGQVTFSESGQPIRLVGVASDITERKQVEEEQARLLELEQAARTVAETTNRVKDEFLATLSHELRAPLNAILGWSQLLRSRQLDPATITSAIETIERNAKLQTQLIEDLLDISRIIQGKLRLATAPLNLIAPIEAAIETMRPAAEAKTIQIHSLLDANVGMISGDASRLQQIFWNLLSNAIKFTPKSGQVTVKLEKIEQRAAEDGETVRENEISSQTLTSISYAQIAVSDTGLGISPEFLPHVFDSFRQADASTTRHYNGLGLGLAIVRHLVELHGGTVAAASPGEGQGATFTVRLPILPEINDWTTAAPAATPVETKPLTPDYQPYLSSSTTAKAVEVATSIELTSRANLPLRGVSVLVVDDEADSREFARFVLEKSGAIVRSTASVAEALAALTQSVPDVLISDLSMPKSDGYSLLHQIKQLQAGQLAVGQAAANCNIQPLGEIAVRKLAQLKTIALTARTSLEDRRKTLAAGFQHHLAKPVEPVELITAIETAMQTHQQANQ